MVRVQLACVLVAVSIGTASAGPTHKVTVETIPPHATVYLNDKDSPPVCTDTPCTFDAPVGDTPVIVEHDKYGPLIDLIHVEKKSTSAAPIRFTFKLAHASATISIQSAAAKGASVTVDDIDQGKVPVEIEVDPGKRHVVVTLNGQKLLDKEVELEVGEERELPVKGPATVVAVKEPPPDPTSDLPDGGGGAGSGSDTPPAVEKHTPEAPHDRYFVVGGALDYVSRDFTYTGGSLAPYDQAESGPLAGPTLEIWPMELLHTGFGRGLSIFARVEFGLTHETVDEKHMDGTTTPLMVSTQWGSIEGDVRYRFTLADTVALQPYVGFVRDQLQYNGDQTMILKVPVADYRSITPGVRVSLMLGAVEPYIVGEDRLVMSGGDLGARFQSPKTEGLHGALGATARLGPVSARVEGSITSYSWTFTNDPQATTATDRLLTLTVQLGVAY